jgi:hypothetical protein
MTNLERAGAWLRTNGLAKDRSDWAYGRDRASLAQLLDEAEERALASATCFHFKGKRDDWEVFEIRPGYWVARTVDGTNTARFESKEAAIRMARARAAGEDLATTTEEREAHGR